jgi:hypothetical protein
MFAQNGSAIIVAILAEQAFVPPFRHVSRYT